MPEKFPSPESEYSFSAEELEIVESLKTKGMEDEETREHFLSWVAEQERSADAAGIPRANIECNLKIARVQAEAGFKDAAADTLEAVRQMASQENEPDLLAQAEAILDKLGL